MKNLISARRARSVAFLVFLLCSTFTQQSFAQNASTYWLANSNNTGANQTPLSLGNLASPTTTASYQIITGDGSSTGYFELHALRYKSNLWITRGDPSSNNNIMSLSGGTGSTTQTALTLYNSTNAATVFFTTLGTSYFNGGAVCINCTNPGSNLLAVQGNFAANKVTVSLSNPFPDYVFAADYHLPSIDSLSRFIAAFHHLPDVPTADIIARDGLNLGENQVAVLKKIEELTLYVIQQNNEIKQLKQQNEALEARNQSLSDLERRISQLEQQNQR